MGAFWTSRLPYGTLKKPDSLRFFTLTIAPYKAGKVLEKGILHLVIYPFPTPTGGGLHVT